MQLGLLEPMPKAPPDRGKPRSLAISALLHVAFFFGLMYTPPISLPSLPPPSPSEYQQAFAGKEDKIVWYKFKELPKITPRNSPPSHQPLRAESKAKQAIVSFPKNAPKRKQVVLAPSTEKIEFPDVDLPNLLAVKLPPKQFTTPPDLIQPEQAVIAAPEAPDAAPSRQLDAAKLPGVRLPGKAYVPPQMAKPPAAVKIEAPDAPDAALNRQLDAAKLPGVRLPPKAYVPSKEVPRPRTAAGIGTPSEAQEYVPQSTVSTKLPATRLPPRPFVPPAPARAPEARGIGAASEAPAVAVSAPSAAAIPSVRLPGRAFAPPPARARAENKQSVAAPQLDADAGDVTIAIANLSPSMTAVKLPAASSPAQFSAGQTVRPDGATSDGQAKGITVPSLYAQAPDGSSDHSKDKKPDLMALAKGSPASKEFMNEAMRYRPPVASGEATIPGAAPHPEGTRVSSAPDPRFNGREVYMMAIQMSNLTSYSGSWLMWYAARTAHDARLQPIAAPVPHRKVDPKYTASAVSDHIEGKIQLYCVIGREGNVTSIELLRGIDDRLNRSAEEALSKWEFYPATRNGQPVDVDVVVEIPFTLAPPATK